MEGALPILEIFDLLAFFLLASFVGIIHAELALGGEAGVDVLPDVLGEVLGFQTVSVEVVVDFADEGLVCVWAGV